MTNEWMDENYNNVYERNTKEGGKEMPNTLSTKEWADKRYNELKKDIEWYIKEGFIPKDAYHQVMDASCLGAGYKAQMRRDFNLGIFE